MFRRLLGLGLMLAVTPRNLATGKTNTLHKSFMFGRSTITEFTLEGCEAIIQDVTVTVHKEAVLKKR